MVTKPLTRVRAAAALDRGSSLAPIYFGGEFAIKARSALLWCTALS